jgi:hypothetical protein
MRNTFLTILGSALLAGSLVQAAAASEHQKAHRAPVTAKQSYRDSNAYFQPAPAPVWAAPAVEPDSSYYQNRGLSAPAGR